MAVAAAFVTQWVGDQVFAWHRRAGYVVLVLIVFRIFWGVWGPRYARFTDFIRGPDRVLVSLRELSPSAHVRRAGHTAAGGWMIVLLLATLGVQAGLGLFANDEVMEVGPLTGYVTQSLSNAMSHSHRLIANGLLAAIALHVLAALYYRIVLKDDLIGALITGRKSGLDLEVAIPSERRWLAVLLLAAAAAGLYALLATAPPPPDVLL